LIVSAALSLLVVLLEIRFPFIDPVALPLPGPLDVRWYGLGYVVGLTIAYFVLRRLSRDGMLRLSEEAIGDLIFVIALGVILGGRLGYILFYDFESFAANPARIIRIWEGGLSFHGGLIGVIVAAWWFARKHDITLIHLMDSMALGIPFGIAIVRTANFINGELYGRVASPDVPWAMRFPTDPIALRLLGVDRIPGMRERELAILEAHASSRWAAIADQVPLRHPSQLYEGLTEGVILGLILWGVYLWFRRRGSVPPTAMLSGIFFIGYGAFRSFVELYRQPDAQFRGPDDPLGTVLGPLTMGQTLSLAMVLVGIGLLVWAATRRPPAPGPPRAAVRRR
jgi:phosphatidylglycerol---prolipoprotein diacylglyceryl transferase